MGRTKAVDEPVSYAKVGMFLHENGGKAKIKTYTSINENLKVDSADRTRKVGEVTVEMHVREDKSVIGNQIYEKNVDSVQVTGSGDPSNETSTSAESPFGDTPVGDDFKRWTKNIIDKLIDAKNTQWVVIGLSLVIGALGLGIALGR